MPERGITTAPELARELGLDAKYLRHLIREHRLVPDHQHGKRYELDPDDVTRISLHPAVRQAVGDRGEDCASLAPRSRERGLCSPGSAVT
jgi:hypothetical protein